jgi:two-component system, chemotaxis family, chemotaxis protein CheY
MEDRVRILLVEKSRTTRNSVAHLLATLGHEIIEAADGVSALWQFSEIPFGLVLTCWNMPYINGIDLIRCLRGNPDHIRLPVALIVNSLEDEQDTKNHLTIRNIACVTQPFTTDDLAAIISKAQETANDLTLAECLAQAQV